MAHPETITNAFELLARAKPASWTILRTGAVEEVLQAWMILLNPLPDTELMQAAIILARQPGAYMPDAGTLYYQALDLMDNSPSAEDAWAELETRIRKRSDAPLDTRTVNALKGLGNFAEWTESDLPHKRRFFIAQFNAARDKWKVEQAAITGPERAKLPEN